MTATPLLDSSRAGSAGRGKFKKTLRGLDALQAVYAVIVALGVKDSFGAGYSFVTKAPYSWQDLGNNNPDNPIIEGLLFLNVFLVGIRFFWLVRNLRSYLVTSARSGQSETAVAGSAPGWASSPMIAGSVLIIFAHAAVFYAMCEEYVFFMFTRATRSAFDASVLEGYVLLHIALLLLNAIWIAMLTRAEERTQSALRADASVAHGGVFWLWNNFSFSTLALGPLVMFSPCKSAVRQCLHGFDAASRLALTTMPTSPEHASFVVQLAGGLHVNRDLALAVMVLLLLLTNSLVDLFMTGSHYIFLEEWEQDEV